MSKIKSYIWALVSVMVAVCCFGLVACANETPPETDGGNNDVEYTITWTVEHATVAATGYDTLPNKLKSGTEVVFTVTMDEGWELLVVSPTNDVSEQTDGSYKFTVSHDIEVRVLTQAEQPPAKQCTLEWSVGEHVTVEVIDHTDYPLSLEEGAIVKFNATPDDGYIVVVSPNTVAKQADGTYIFEVTDDMTIAVSAVIKPEMYSLSKVGFKETGDVVDEMIDDFAREVYLRPFTVSGSFIDAQSAYIKLVEVKSHKAFVGKTVTRGEDNVSFDLEFDYRVLLDEFGNVKKDEYVDFEVYVCATDSNGLEVAERLDSANYDASVFVQPWVATYLLRNVMYKFDYYGHFDSDTDTKIFVALTVDQITDNFSIIDTVIELRDGEGDSKIPYFVITGMYFASYQHDEAMLALNNFIEDLCAFNDWDNSVAFTQSAGLDDDWNYTVAVDLSALEAGKTYVMHTTMKKNNSDGDNNLIFGSESFDEVVVNGNIGYKLVQYNTGWGWNWPGIQVGTVESFSKTLTITGTEIKVVGGKPYFTVTYDYEGYTQEEIEELPVNFDLQCNDNINGGGWARNFFDNDISFVVDEENGTFEVRIDISSLRGLHGYTTHYSLDKQDGVREGENNPPQDYKPDLDGLDGVSVACGDITYTFVYKKGAGEGSEYWGCLGVRLTNTPGYSINVDPVQLASENYMVMYLIINGTYEGYTVDEIKAISIDYQDPDNGWVTTQFTAEQIHVRVYEADGTFQFKIDITDIPNGQYFIHFNNGDVGSPDGIDAVPCDGRTCSYEERDFGSWSSYVLTIKDAE